MQLLYIWVENFKCLSDASMNFCEYPRFNYDKQIKLLSQSLDLKTSKTIFPLPLLGTEEKNSCIENISIIVGSNGSGKTSICSLLREIFCNDYNEHKYILIFRIENNLFCKTNYDKNELKLDNKIKLQNYGNHRLNKFDFKMIYYSPFYTTNHPFDDVPYNPDFFIDCSTSCMLKNDLEKYQNPHSAKEYDKSINLLQANKIKDYERCITVLANKDSFYEMKDKSNNALFKLGTTLPEKVYFSYDKNAFGFFESDYKDNVLGLLQFYNGIKQKIAPSSDKKTFFIDNCSLAMFCSFSRDWLTFEFERNFPESLATIWKKLNSISTENKPLVSIIKDVFILLHNIFEKINDKAVFTHTCMTVISFIEYIEKIDGRYFSQDIIIFNIKDDYEKITYFYGLYQHIVEITEFATFSFWPLQSSGEFSELLLYGRLFDVMKSFASPKCPKNILLFFDEVEITLHPNLQRQLILNICIFLQTFYKDFKFQIVFATHSPIILSDIPKSNVIFLEKKEGENKSKIRESSLNSFAGNIGEMYYENFFMEETIGALAKYEIQNALELIKNGKKKDAAHIIELVGDELLRRVLQNKMGAN